jgi:hypothetical protein
MTESASSPCYASAYVDKDPAFWPLLRAITAISDALEWIQHVATSSCLHYLDDIAKLKLHTTGAVQVIKVDGPTSW